jgi:hypothetical protein
MVERMESRVCPSSALGPVAPTGSGVDALGMGDFNAYRVVDIAVASHQHGNYSVSRRRFHSASALG